MIYSRFYRMNGLKSFSRPVKLVIFAYQEILACFSDETQVRDECGEY